MQAAAVTPSGAINLAEFKVLVIEDDYFVAKEIATALRAHGAQVIGPAPDAARGRALISADSPDCALLDVNLKGQFAFDLAHELRERGVPLIFTTGYDASFLPADLRGAPCLNKPIDIRSLVRTIQEEAKAAHASE